jgi:hypothetical protein
MTGHPALLLDVPQQIGVQPNLRAKAEHDRRDEIAVVEQLRASVRPSLCERNHAEVEDQEPEHRQRSGRKRAKQRRAIDLARRGRMIHQLDIVLRRSVELRYTSRRAQSDMHIADVAHSVSVYLLDLHPTHRIAHHSCPLLRIHSS